MKSRMSVLGWFLVFSSANAMGAENVTYYYTDAHGTPLATADASGSIVTALDYHPYGAQVLGTMTTGPSFTSHVTDADSGLIYMQARYYDPATERFLSVDPAGFAPNNVFGINRYLYAYDNPVVFLDPDGRFARGDNFTETQWRQFREWQRREAQRLVMKSKQIRNALDSGDGLDKVKAEFEKAFGEGSATTDNLNTVADSLSKMAEALNDDGTLGYVATGENAAGWAALGKHPDDMAAAPINGKQMYVNLSHPAYSNGPVLGHAIAHESAHDIGLQHGQLNGVTAYKFGDANEREAFRELPSRAPGEALHNPDTIVDYAK